MKVVFLESFWLCGSPLYSHDSVKCKCIIGKAVVNMFTALYISLVLYILILTPV